MGTVKVLFLAANPAGIDRLGLDNEIRAITDKIRASKHRDAIQLISVWATRPDDLLQALNEHRPQVVHFSGHGSETGELLLVDEKRDVSAPVSAVTLKTLFETLRDNIRVVVLNACYSHAQAEAIAEVIDCVVGMNAAIGDEAAVAFAASFYRAIGFDRSVQDAFDQGKLALMLSEIPESAAPELLCRAGVDPSRLILTTQGVGQAASRRGRAPIRTTPEWTYPVGCEPPPQDGEEDIVLLMGAGVSNYLGLPTLDGLLQQAILGDDDVASRIRNTRNAIEANTRRTRARFEELISQLWDYLRVAEMLRRDITFRNELGGYLPTAVDNGELGRKWWSALTRCYRIVLNEYGPQKVHRESTEFGTILALLGELAEINSGRLHVYTTNYDCSLQVLASYCQDLTFFTHIDNTNGSFMDRWYRANLGVEDRGQPSIYVHRFHGCVAWFANARRPFGVEEVYGAGSVLEIQDDDKLHSMQIKLTSSQAVGANPAFALAFAEFCGHLQRSKILLVWGYSFRDIEIIRDINQALAQQAPLLVLYIDPYLSEEQALQYIRATMDDVPISIDPNFIPKRIDWKPTDDHGGLVDKVRRSVRDHLDFLRQGQ